MLEPITTGATANTMSPSIVGLIALAISTGGPNWGPYFLIGVCAVGGSLWPLSNDKTLTRWSGAALVARCTLTALALTGIIASYLQAKWDITANEAYGPVAFCIGAMGSGWKAVFESLGGFAQTFFRGKQ